MGGDDSQREDLEEEAASAAAQLPGQMANAIAVIRMEAEALGTVAAVPDHDQRRSADSPGE